MSRSSSSGNSRLSPPRVPVRERADGEVRRDLWRCGERGVRGVKGVSGTSWLVLYADELDRCRTIGECGMYVCVYVCVYVCGCICECVRVVVSDEV